MNGSVKESDWKLFRKNFRNGMKHLVELAYEGAIGPDDIDGFSEELKEQLAYVIGKNQNQ